MQDLIQSLILFVAKVIPSWVQRDTTKALSLAASLVFFPLLARIVLSVEFAEKDNYYFITH